MANKNKVSEKDLPAIVEAIIRMENQPEIAEQYLNEDIFNEAMDLAKYNLDSNTSFSAEWMTLMRYNFNKYVKYIQIYT